MNFKLNITIQKNNFFLTENRWQINVSVGETRIHDEKFFVEGVETKSYTEDKKKHSYQTFRFNKKLFAEIQELLFPGSNKNYVSAEQEVAWDYYHYCSYENLSFNVHPVSISADFFRFEFEGSQEAIYEKCLDINKNWTSFLTVNKQNELINKNKRNASKRKNTSTVGKRK
jgi:hypothetical protein